MLQRIQSVQRFGNRILTSKKSFSESLLKPSTPFFRKFMTAPNARTVVITAAGPDRVGVVHEMATQLGPCNVEDSRMTVLGGEFAIILRVTLAADTTPEALRESLTKALPDYILSLRETSQPVPLVTSKYKICQISLEGRRDDHFFSPLPGPDQPGVVKELSAIIVKHKASIQDLNTETTMAPFSGYRIFSMKTTIAIPLNYDATAIRKDLRNLEDRLGVDVFWSEHVTA